MPRCINCQRDLANDCFSNKQLKNKAGPKCVDCVSGKILPKSDKPAEPAPPPEKSNPPQATQLPSKSAVEPSKPNYADNKAVQQAPAWGMNQKQNNYQQQGKSGKKPYQQPNRNGNRNIHQKPAWGANPAEQPIVEPVTKPTEQPPPPSATLTDTLSLPAVEKASDVKEEKKAENPYRDLEIYTISATDPRRPNIPVKYTFKVFANMFKIDISHMCQFINHYDLSITVPSAKTDVKVKDEIIAQVWKFIETQLIPSYNLTPKPLLIFDSKKNILVNQIIPFPNDCFEADMDIKMNNKTTTYHIKITLVDRNIDMYHILQYPAKIKDCPLLQYSILDNIFAYFNSKFYLKVGAKYFDPRNRTPLGKGAEIYDGFHQGVRRIQAGNAINVDIANTAFIEALPIPQFIEHLFTDRRGEFSLRSYENKHGKCCLDRRQIKQLKGEISNYLVICKHQGFAHQYRVMGVSENSADQYEFEIEKGKKTTVSQYFVNQYNIKLRYPTLPVLLLGGNKIAMPAELCVIKENQRRKKKVSDEQQATMVRETAKRPADRKRIIMDILKNNQNIYSSLNKEMGINVDTKFMECNAMLLDEPKIKYANQMVDPNNGGWNQKGVKLLKPMDLNSCAVINCDYRFNAKDGITRFFEMGERMGIRVPRNTPPIYNYDNRNGYNEIYNIFDRIFQKGEVQIVFVYIPRRETEIYTHIKKASDYHNKIPSQVMVTSSVLKGRDQYSSNVWLKVNGKLGGINFTAMPPKPALKNPLTAVPTILLGADVTHPSPGTNMKSIAAVVCSTDLEGLRVASEWRCQESRVEIIQNLGDIVEKFLKNWIKHNPNVVPKRILFYRDGVSISQRPIVQEEEIPLVSMAIKKVFGDKSDIKLTFLLVRKRHHVRFFSEDKRFVDRNGNIVSGAVIDNSVCNPDGYDWYCYSHGGLQGTSKPTLYDVLYDEVKWDPNDLYLTTYWQCFTFIRSTKAVSIPPMAYYAHLTAFRARYLTKVDDSTSVVSGGSEETDTSVLMAPSMYNVMYYI